MLKYVDVEIIIAARNEYCVEILEDIRQLGIVNTNISIFRIGVESYYSGIKEIQDQLDKRTIDLGQFLYTNKMQFQCKELTFLAGGSGVLDYIFLKTIAKISKAKEYLEIGTYIGESINNLTDCCEKLYSVTADVGAKYSMRESCKYYRIPDFSERLTYNEKIIHYYGDSKQFDFSKHADTIDLYFIDGDHSYNGVYCDTKNIFENKKRDAIVIWHDFKEKNNQYNIEVVKAVRDVLEEKFEDVYVTNNNICGIYIPKNRKHEFGFELREQKYEENAPLYTYDIILDNIQIK